MTATLMQGWFHLAHSGQLFDSFLWHVMPRVMWIAQAVEDTLGSSVGDAWNNFIESGQVWALLVGIFIGYLFRSITAY